MRRKMLLAGAAAVAWPALTFTQPAAAQKPVRTRCYATLKSGDQIAVPNAATSADCDSAIKRCLAQRKMDESLVQSTSFDRNYAELPYRDRLQLLTCGEAK